MEAKRFDDLARSIASSMSRRQTLKLLTAGVFTGIGTLIGSQISKAMLPLQQSTPTPTPAYKMFLPLVTHDCVSNLGHGTPTFQVVDPDQVQAILQAADQDVNFQALQTLLDNSGFMPSVQEGALILDGGILVAQVAIVRYQPPEPPDQAYLVYGINDCGESLAIILSFDVDNRVGLGFYRDKEGVIKVEVVSFEEFATKTDQTKQLVPPQNRMAAVSESCQICLDKCVETQQLRQTHCLLRSAVAAVSVGFTTRKVFREALEETLEETLENIGRTAGDLNSIHSGLGGIQGCIDQSSPDCTTEGRMCRTICKGCDSAQGVICQTNKACIAGECRAYCKKQDILCGVTEMCIGDDRCVPLTELCGAYEYMGPHRYGDGYAPSCCPLIGGINCGLKADGSWNGCCPATTLCYITDTTVGCCIPGLNCD